MLGDSSKTPLCEQEKVKKQRKRKLWEREEKTHQLK